MAGVSRRPVNVEPGMAKHRWWPLVRRLLNVGFLVLVSWLIFNHARTIEWEEVADSMVRIPWPALLLAGGLALASYTLYSSFDLIGRYCTAHGLSIPRVMAVTFVSYAFNLNLGALVGGFAFRYRLYSRFGLDNEIITRVLSLSLLTNWLGYVFLAGSVFLLHPLALPPGWKIGSTGLQVLGGALLTLAVGYLLVCGLAKQRSLVFHGHKVTLPPTRLALLQFAMSSCNWLIIAGVLFMLLQQRIDYPTVLGVLLVAAVAGVITHVPAGLGVLEAVFVGLLSHRLPKSELLAALLAYRAIYYLAPLGVAALVFLVIEMRAKKRRLTP